MSVHEKAVTDFTTGEIREVNDNFVQMYTDHLHVIRDMAHKNPTALRVFLWLIEKMDTNNSIVVSFSALSEALQISERTAKYAIAFLKDTKTIAVFKSGNTNVYAINSKMAWKSDANHKQYALFTSRVYISKSEQETPYITQLSGHAVKKRPSSHKRQTQLDNIAGIGGSAALLSMSVCSLLQAITL